MNIKIITAIIVIVAGTMLLTKCNTNRSEIYRYDKYIKDNFETYKDLRASVTDTIQKWKNDSLSAVTNIFYGETWNVDSVMLFNRDSSRFFTTINRSFDEIEDATVDYISGLEGIKVKGKWYFQLGGNHYIGRAGRKYDIYDAMTLEELSYISRTRIMSKFLKVDEEGNYTVDYNEMDEYFYKAYKSLYPDIDKIDSIILTRIASYHKRKIDPKEIERIKDIRNKSVRPPQTSTRKISFMRGLFEEEKTPLFETEAWKNRRRTDK